MRKTSQDYWDGVWTRQTDVPVLLPDSKDLGREFDRAVDRFARSALKSWGGKAETLVEIGCGGTRFLPYFSRYHGLKISGLDYSEDGCRSARDIFTALNVEGEIRRGDMFDPPADFGPFDVVFSWGLLEHFQDTALAVKALRSFLKPGGLMLSVIPNMRGIPGFVQKKLDRAVFDLHAPLDVLDLAEAHKAAGLDVLEARYMMTVNLSVFHCHFSFPILNRAWPYFCSGASQAVWAVERMLGRGWPNRFTSPYAFCSARLP